MRIQDSVPLSLGPIAVSASFRQEVACAWHEEAMIAPFQSGGCKIMKSDLPTDNTAAYDGSVRPPKHRVAFQAISAKSRWSRQKLVSRSPHWLLFLLFASLVCKGQQKGITPFKAVPRRNQTELQDKNGEVRFWIDKMGRTHSPEVMLQQQGYNDWLFQSFHTSFGIGPGMSAPAGIELMPPQPPGERGIKSTGVFQVPLSIRANGVLTRDTRSITFYKAGVQWNYAAGYLVADCQELHNSVDSSVDCSRYQINWRSSDQLRTPAGNDPFLLETRYVELQKSKKTLSEWQELLDSVYTVTASGRRSDASQDRQESDARKQTFNGDFDADDFTSPPDWLTAQVDAGQLTPQFLEKLAKAEKEVLAHLNAERMEREFGQNSDRRNRTNR